MKTLFARRAGCVRFVMALVLATWTTNKVAANDWSGWRGNEAQGVSSTPGPVDWSAEENVIWKAEVAGRGHSSPVIAGDKVFVTSAYATKRGPELRLLFIRITNAIGLIVGIIGAVHVARQLRTNQVHLALSLCVLGGLFAKEVNSAVRYAFGTHREAYYLSWLDSHLVIGLACVIAITVVGRRWRFALAAGLIGSGLALAGLRPDPEYYGFVTGAHHLRGTSSAILGILLGSGCIAMCAAILGTDRSKESPNDSNRSNGIVWALLAFAIGLGSLGVPSLLRFFHSWQPDVAMPWIMLSQIGMRTCAILLGIVLWCFVGLPRVPERSNAKIAVGVLVVAGLTFWTTNHLRSEDTYGRAIVCLDVDSGEQLWSCEALYGPVPSTHLANSPASPTASVDGDRVYAYFGTAGMMAASLTGELLWTNTDLPFEGIHGVAASPIARDGVVFVTSGNSKSPFIAAIDGKTGSRNWTAKLHGWDGLHGEHRTPLIVSSSSPSSILNWSMMSTRLTGYDVHNGCESIEYETHIENTGEAVASLLVDQSTLYLSSKSTVAAVSWPQEGDELIFKWTATLRSKGPNTASPVLHDGHMYLVSDHGIATVLDASNGEVCWQKRLSRGSYYSSPIVMGDHVYFSNDRGMTTVVACGPEFNKVAENLLPDGIYASSAPRNDRLIIRTETALWCIGRTNGERSSSPSTERLSKL